VFCCEFGKDIGLLDNEAPGVQGQYTIQVTPTFKNTGTNPFTADFLKNLMNFLMNIMRTFKVDHFIQNLRMLLIKLREGFNAEPTLLRRLLQLWLVVFLPLLALLLPYLELVPVHAEFVV
jgi:hypothetical protein